MALDTNCNILIIVTIKETKVWFEFKEERLVRESELGVL